MRALQNTSILRSHLGMDDSRIAHTPVTCFGLDNSCENGYILYIARLPIRSYSTQLPKDAGRQHTIKEVYEDKNLVVTDELGTVDYCFDADCRSSGAYMG